MEHDAVAVIDFGGQYAHLIATKVRALGVLAEIRQPEDPIERFQAYQGIIISGSPSLSAFGEDADYTRAIYDLPVPILGFCFGHQEIAKHYGGQVIHGGREWGPADLHLVRPHPLFEGLDATERVWMSHFDSVTGVGPEFEELGYTLTGAAGERHRFAAIGSDRLRRYGFQFHPEVDDTVHGERMIANFVLRICGCRPTWTTSNYAAEIINRVRAQVGDGRVFLLASGGVDSTVAARLLAEALGPARLRLLHIDNGLMRQDESRQVLHNLARMGLGAQTHFVDATEEILTALAGVTDPETKRRHIGATFVTVFEREARRLGITDHLLGQGTIYPDTIETGGTRRADVIKTHHNRVPVIEEMIAAGRVVEPLADLYKVEVRRLGEALGLPPELVWRHPFPGPGLGIRLLCADGGEEAAALAPLGAAAAAIAAPYGLAAMPLPIRSVGVKADLRSYEHPLLLTGAGPWDQVVAAAGQIFQAVAGVNRCVWNLEPEAPPEIRPAAATVTRARLDLLRAADACVMGALRRHGLYELIWQCPTVLVPLTAPGRGDEFVVIRPVLSERAMTAAPAELPPAVRAELHDALLALPGVWGVGLDVTSKPPGTIEWE